MAPFLLPCLVFALLLISTQSFAPLFKSNAISNIAKRQRNTVMMADVEIVFPNNKKTKVAVGSALKDAAKKAGMIMLQELSY